VLAKDRNVTGYRIDNAPSLYYVGSAEESAVYGLGLYGSSERGVAEHYAQLVKKKARRVFRRRIFSTALRWRLAPREQFRVARTSMATVRPILPHT
jgi:hypothetical protein